MLQQGEDTVKGKVIGRAVGPHGEQLGSYDDNPLLNSVVYEVEFPDGQVKEYSANIIAENILTQVDSDGYSMTMLDAIVDYRKDDSKAVPMEDKYLITNSGQ